MLGRVSVGRFDALFSRVAGGSSSGTADTVERHIHGVPIVYTLKGLGLPL